MLFFKFLKDIFLSKPLTITTVSILFFVAGLLELLSLAMILPVLSELFDSSQATGIAGIITQYLGFEGPSISTALFFIATFMCLRGILLMSADFVMVKVARDLEVEIRSQIFASLLKASWSYIQTQEIGKLPNLILRETEKYSVAIQKLGQFLSSFLIASVLIISSLFASWKLAVLFIIAIIPYLLFVRILGKKIAYHAEKRLVEANGVSGQISENLMHLKYIKSSALSEHVMNRFNTGISAYAYHFFRVMCCARFIKNFPEIFGVIIIATLVFYAHSMMEMQSTDIIFFLLLMFRGYRQVSGVQTVLSSLIENIPSYKVCRQFLKDSKENRESSGGQKLQKHENAAIKMENVSYAYTSREVPVLNNISLELPEKGIIVFAGKSGAGKTTLVDIMLGLLPSKGGTVSINDETNLSDVSIDEWREMVGYVPQEPFLVSGSIKDNILLHASDNSDENLSKVTKQAQIEEFISALPERYETNVGLINTGLSGGQKQRIALARALAKNPALLILDEATSALDPKTEREISNVIKEISKTKLVIMIAHSTEMMKAANHIYFMEGGEIVGSGSYDDLAKNNTHFLAHISDI